MRVIFALLFLTSLFACEADYYPEDSETPVLVATLLPLPHPNQYQVELSWTTDDTPDTWEVFRQEEGASPSRLTQLESEARNYTDSSIQAARKYSYELRELRQNNFEVRGTTEITIPLDYEVKGLTNAPAEITAHRVFFQKSSKLIIENRPLKIVAHHIHADDATIETFAQTNSKDTHGRHGGRIEIKADFGSGRLLIIGRGEDGRIGRSGKDGTPGRSGGEGTYALSTHETVDVVCNCGRKEESLVHTIKTGAFFEKQRAYEEFLKEKARHRCIKEPSDGERGQSGGKGEDGEPGGNGGNSSEVVIEITQNSDLEIKTDFAPGKGAPGGAGGRGGNPGNGGPPGKRDLDRFKVCRVPQQGENGSHGADGATGQKGDDGKKLPFCLKIKNQKLGDC